MTVAGLAIDATSRSPIILLRDPSGRRQVPIWIDNAQAHNILAGIQNTKNHKPLSHDLMISLMDAGSLILSRVIIYELDEKAFQAVLKVHAKSTDSTKENDAIKNEVEIEARPSDAIALAIRAKCGIWMLEKIVAEASIPVDAEADEEDSDKFRRFLDHVSPAALIRHLKTREGINDPPFNSSDSDSSKEPFN